METIYLLLQVRGHAIYICTGIDVMLRPIHARWRACYDLGEFMIRHHVFYS